MSLSDIDICVKINVENMHEANTINLEDFVDYKIKWYTFATQINKIRYKSNCYNEVISKDIKTSFLVEIKQFILISYSCKNFRIYPLLLMQ